MSQVLSAPLSFTGTGNSEALLLDGAEAVGLYAAAGLVGSNYTFLTKQNEGDSLVAVSGASLAHSDGVFLPFGSDLYTKLLGCRYLAIKSDGDESSNVRSVVLVYKKLTP